MRLRPSAAAAASASPGHWRSCSHCGAPLATTFSANASARAISACASTSETGPERGMVGGWVGTVHPPLGGSGMIAGRLYTGTNREPGPRGPHREETRPMKDALARMLEYHRAARHCPGALVLV